MRINNDFLYVVTDVHVHNVYEGNDNTNHINICNNATVNVVPVLDKNVDNATTFHYHNDSYVVIRPYYHYGHACMWYNVHTTVLRLR